MNFKQLNFSFFNRLLRVLVINDQKFLVNKMTASGNWNVKDVLRARNGSTYQALMTEIKDFVRHEKKRRETPREWNCGTRNLPENSVLSVRDILCESTGGFATHDMENPKLHQSTVRFGKPSRADNSGSRVKKLMYCRNDKKH